MAKTNSEGAPKSGFRAKGYIAAAILLLVVLTLNSVMVYFTHRGTRMIFENTSAELSLINSSNSQLQEANEHVLEIVGGIGGTNAMQGHINAISALFDSIRSNLDRYEALDDHDEMALRRFNHARAYIDAYDNKMKQYRDMIYEYQQNNDAEGLATFLEQIPNIYQQEIAPLQSAASEMMVASVSIAITSANRRGKQSIRYVYLIVAILAGVLIIGETALFFIARYNKRSVEEIERKNRQYEEAASKLGRSRERMKDIAVTNILTNMKNRYALDQDLSERLATDQFNMAVFNVDNFRSINDLYGYDFGDELLSMMAERLRERFGEHAEIYNITGNEFVFIFNRDVSDNMAMQLIDGIVQAFASPYTVSNLTVQLTVTGVHYHYLAGDCLNVNSLLVKVDNVIREAKRAGGAQVRQVVDI